MAFVRATKTSEVAPGTVRELQLDGKTVALANVEGKLFATDNTSPHRGGPLGQGYLEGNCITCPWHGWEYDVTTGKVIANPSVGVECYPVELRGDDIFVDCG